MSQTNDIFRLLDGIHGEIYIDVRQDIEESADERHLRASLYRYERGRHGMIPLEGEGEWHSIVGVGGRQLRVATLTRDGRALAHLVDGALQNAVRRVVEGCVLDRAVLPPLPFALFALDHAEGVNDDSRARAMIELWDASPEQWDARRKQARALMHWARWAP